MMMEDVPMGRAGGLTSLDATFLDGMLSLHDDMGALAEKYISDSDASSSTSVVDVARMMADHARNSLNMLKEMRGHADGDELRKTEHVENVEVSSSY